MANASVFEQGYEQGQSIALARRQHAQMLKDQAHDEKVNDLHAIRAGLLSNLSALGADKTDPKYFELQNQLLQTQENLNQLLDPVKHPGALQRLAKRIGLGPKSVSQSVTDTPSATTVSTSLPAIELGATPSYSYTPESLPSQRKSTKTQEVSGVEAATIPEMPNAPVTLPASAPTTVQGPKRTPAELKQEAERLRKSQTETERLIAAAPESPEQESARKYSAQINAQLSVIDKSGLSEDDKEKAREAVFKIYQKPNNKIYKDPSGNIYAADINDPDSFIPGSVPYKEPTPASEKVSDYEKYKAGGGTDSFIVWLAKNSKVPMPGTKGWFYSLPPDQQAIALKNERLLAEARNPFGAENAATARARLGISEEQLQIAKDRLMYGPEAGNVSTLQKSASMLEEEARTAEERAKDPNHPPIADTGIIMAWVKSQIAGVGRLNNTEIEQAIKSGNFNQQISNRFGRQFTGQLDDSFRNDMVKDIRLSANAAKVIASNALGQYQSDVGGGIDNPPKPSGTTPSAPVQPKRIVSITDAMKKPKYKNMTRKQVSDAITKAGYIPE